MNIAPPVHVDDSDDNAADDATNDSNPQPSDDPKPGGLITWVRLAYLLAAGLVIAAIVFAVMTRKPGGSKAVSVDSSTQTDQKPAAAASTEPVTATAPLETSTATVAAPAVAGTVEEWQNSVTTTMNNHEDELYGDSPVKTPSRLDAAEAKIKALEAKIAALEK